MPMNLLWIYTIYTLIQLSLYILKIVVTLYPTLFLYVYSSYYLMKSI